MLNLGMTEILCFAIIALLVLGPEKLPEAARFTAKWYGKFKRFVSNIQNEIDRELRLSEFREEMQKEIHRISELEARMQKQLDKLQLERINKATEQSVPISKAATKKIYIPCPQPVLIPFKTHSVQSSSQIDRVKNETSPTLVQLKVAV
ncbi:twin-arginine translocase subunit TatB [Acinetobacter sp. ANC 4779]|uniref:Sec-independent protein translocase protein TatB n=1 Tax=Acinetobacter sp. ANC 4779 TaxID=2529848 RepID=UPI00103CC65A|nr:Sec-independent protein translocase protein TatB [Acinetobacter sp. ANC 4779]TCB51783.1 twin-arginine translocase subunit TatB [Acinetobacter sp. ANC 4779]